MCGSIFVQCLDTVGRMIGREFVLFYAIILKSILLEQTGMKIKEANGKSSFI